MAAFENLNVLVIPGDFYSIINPNRGVSMSTKEPCFLRLFLCCQECECLACVYSLVLLEPEEGVGFPGIGVTGGAGNQIPVL